MSEPRRDEPGQAPGDTEVSSLSRLRDFDKVRERMVLRIEVRHIVQLAVLVLFLAGAAFVGGWAAGKQGWQPSWLAGFSQSKDADAGDNAPPPAPTAALAVAPPAAATAVAATAGVEAAAPGEQVVVAAQDSAAATGAVADVDLAPAASAVAAAPAPDAGSAPASAAPDAGSAPAAVEVAKVEPATVEPAKPEPAAAEATKADTLRAGTGKGEPAAADSEEGRPAEKALSAKDKAAAARLAKRALKALKAADATADVAGNDNAADKAADKATDKAPETPRAGRPAAGKYMVQIKAFRNEPEAQAFADELRGKGYTVSVSTVEVPDKGQFFRVRLGPFGTLDAARAAQKRLETAEGHATIILSVP